MRRFPSNRRGGVKSPAFHANERAPAARRVLFCPPNGGWGDPAGEKPARFPCCASLENLLYCYSMYTGGKAPCGSWASTPGYATIGFGLITAERAQVNMLTYGAITTPAGLPLSRRLYQIGTDMEDLIGPAEAGCHLHRGAVLQHEPDHRHRRGPRPRRAAVHGGKVRDPAPRVHPLPGEDGGGGLRQGRKAPGDGHDPPPAAPESRPRPDDAADALALALCHARSATSRLPLQDSRVKETI